MFCEVVRSRNKMEKVSLNYKILNQSRGLTNGLGHQNVYYEFSVEKATMVTIVSKKIYNATMLLIIS